MFVCLLVCFTEVKPRILRRFPGLQLRTVVDLSQLELYQISKLSSLDLGHCGFVAVQVYLCIGLETFPKLLEKPANVGTSG